MATAALYADFWKPSTVLQLDMHLAVHARKVVLYRV